MLHPTLGQHLGAPCLRGGFGFLGSWDVGGMLQNGAAMWQSGTHWGEPLQGSEARGSVGGHDRETLMVKGD